MYPFLSTKSIRILHPIHFQMQLGYLYSYSQTEAHLMDNALNYQINEANSGLKIKGTMSVTTVLGVSVEYFFVQNEQKYVVLNASLGFDF